MYQAAFDKILCEAFPCISSESVCGLTFSPNRGKNPCAFGGMWYNKFVVCKNIRKGGGITSGPVSILQYLGRCGARVFIGIARFFLRCLKGLLQFGKDFLHGCLRILKFCWRILTQPIRLHSKEAERIYADWKTVRDAPKGTKILTMCKSVLVGIFSENGIFITMLRYALPIVCCGFLWSLVSYGTSLRYGVEVSVNGCMMGYLESEADYDKAEEIVRTRLSYAAEPPDVHFTKNLQIVSCEEGEAFLTAGGLADKMLEISDISLCKGYGVYRGEEFLGAVSSPKPIQAALSRQLSDYMEAMAEDADDVYYSDQMSYVEGTYLADSLTDVHEIVKKLTAVTVNTGVYNAAPNDTLHAVAERYSTTLEYLRTLNPDIPDLLTTGMQVMVPIEVRSMPITYTKTKRTVSFINYDTVNVETSMLPVGKREILQQGIKGEKDNLVQVTYVNGAEVKSTLLESKLISEPVTEQVGIGTYAAAPASATTVLTGTGEYGWPVNGGRISDVFISNRNHRGLDIAAPGGTEIYAAADGIVTAAQWNNSYGNYMKVDHGDGRETLYAHCSLLLATEGMEVKRGQVIGQVGTTGHSTGNHLHFEVRIDGVNHDPAAFLRVNAD